MKSSQHVSTSSLHRNRPPGTWQLLCSLMRSTAVALALLGAHHASCFVVEPASGALARARARHGTSPSSTVEMSAAPKLVPFSKYQGLGNDFILVDNREVEEPMLTAGESADLCDRRYGIGGDGVIFALPGSNGMDYSMRIINSDGSEPEMCGNGIRCMARFLADLEGKKEAEYKIHTLAGTIIPVAREDGQVTVDMGPPELNGPKVPSTLPTNADGVVLKEPIQVDGKEWEVTCVSMGNPHAVVFVPDVAALDLPALGPQFETHPSFPAKINTEFVQVLNRGHVKMVVWERGCGITQACGTGACALVVAAVLAGLADRKCTVTLPGGDLLIEWRESDGKVYMTGPAELAFQGDAVVR